MNLTEGELKCIVDALVHEYPKHLNKPELLEPRLEQILISYLGSPIDRSISGRYVESAIETL